METIAPKVLMVASMSYAGMGPYVTTIVNSFRADDNIDFFLIETGRPDYTNNIKDSLRGHASIVRESNNRLTAIKTLFTARTVLRKNTKNIIRRNRYDIVHFITPIQDLNLVRWILRKGIKVIGTVHDLNPHDSDKAFYKQLKQNVMFGREQKCYAMEKYFLTNSLEQYKELCEKFPSKKIFYTDFPSLITSDIEKGGLSTQELAGIDKYILFFGRVEAYKGVELLIDAFEEIVRGLPADTHLVIAGKGEMNRSVNSDRIIRIDRYIDDREIAGLYRNAEFVVYPYISATQSGVLSVAAYFGTPILASDVPFFKSQLSGVAGCELFEAGNKEDLKKRLVTMSELERRETAGLKEFYKTHYASSGQREALLKIYSDVASQQA